MPIIKRIVLTGGSCGGKTSGSAAICDAMRRAGWLPLVIPEAATILISSGVTPPLVGARDFQVSVLQTQIYLEEHYYQVAKGLNCNVVMICDRGRLDGKAFCSPEEWASVLDCCDIDSTTRLLSPYDGVIHMASAAVGARDHYTLENNKARFETVDEASASDFRIRMAWDGHHTLRFIDNSTDFTTKVAKVVSEVLQICGASNVLPVLP